MAQCRSCGGDNPAGAQRCEYCDQPLVSATTAIAVSWTASTSEGASGRGRVQVHAPSGATVDRVQAAAEAAFAAAVDALGPRADADDVADAMRERLAGLLPGDHVLAGFELDVFGPASAAPPAAGGAAAAGSAAATGVSIVGALVFLMFASCLLCSGILFIFMGGKEGELADRVDQARVVTADVAADAEGLVCVEAEVAEVDSALVVPPEDVAPLESAAGEATRCIYYSVRIEPKREVEVRRDGEVTTERRRRGSSRTEKRHVSSFTLLGLSVHTSGDTKFDDGDADPFLELEATDGHYTYSGLPADVPITVVGEARDGKLDASIVSGRLTQGAIAGHVRSQARIGAVMGWICTGFGALLVLAAGLLLLLRWRAR